MAAAPIYFAILVLLFTGLLLLVREIAIRYPRRRAWAVRRTTYRMPPQQFFDQYDWS